MDSHLVTVEVSVESNTDQRVKLNGLALNQHRLKSLNAQAVKGWCAVKKYWTLLNNLFQRSPNLWSGSFNHALGALDVLS